jgi:hypothetical protein
MKTKNIATIGSWHSHHLETNSKGEAILVTDGFSKDWDGPIYTREDGTWGHDLTTSIGRALAKFEKEQRQHDQHTD